jgi:hypothetical protein
MPDVSMSLVFLVLGETARWRNAAAPKIALIDDIVAGVQHSHGWPSPLLPSLQRVRHPPQLPQERLPRVQLPGVAGKMAFRVRPPDLKSI